MLSESESQVAQSCPTLGDPMDWSLPGSSIHGIFQARPTQMTHVRDSDFRQGRSGPMWPRVSHSNCWTSVISSGKWADSPPAWDDGSGSVLHEHSLFSSVILASVLGQSQSPLSFHPPKLYRAQSLGCLLPVWSPQQGVGSHPPKGHLFRT